MPPVKHTMFMHGRAPKIAPRPYADLISYAIVRGAEHAGRSGPAADAYRTPVIPRDTDLPLSLFGPSSPVGYAALPDTGDATRFSVAYYGDLIGDLMTGTRKAARVENELDALKLSSI